MLKKSIKNLGLAFASVALSWTFIKIEPVQAASFRMSFSGGLSEAEGYLEFEKSNLKGIGLESITLSELYIFNEGEVSFDYSYSLFDTIFDDTTPVFWTGEPKFYFDSGNLVGMDLDSDPANYRVGDCRHFPCTIFTGTVRYSVRGNVSQEFWTGRIDSYFEDDDPFIPDSYFITDEVFNAGRVNFTTIEPVEGAIIPEPLTLLGVTTATSFGAFFKRKVTNLRYK